MLWRTFNVREQGEFRRDRIAVPIQPNCLRFGKRRCPLHKESDAAAPVSFSPKPPSTPAGKHHPVNLRMFLTILNGKRAWTSPKVQLTISTFVARR